MSDHLSIQLTPQSAETAKQTAAEQAALDNAKPSWGVQGKIHNSVTTSSLASNGVRTDTVTNDTQKATSGDDRGALDASGAIIVKNQNGRTLSRDQVRPNSIVTVLGVETTLAAALAGGLITELGDGRYAPAGEAAAGAPGVEALSRLNDKPVPNDPSKPDPNAPAIELLSPASEALMSEISSKVDTNTALNSMRQMISSGVMSDELVDKVSAQRGITKEQVTGDAQALYADYVGQAKRAMGPDADKIIEWAKATLPAAELQRISEEHGMSGSTKVYSGMVEKYYETIPQHSPHLLTEAVRLGIVTREKNGTYTCTPPGNVKMSFGNAMKLGLLNFRNVK